MIIKIGKKRINPDNIVMVEEFDAIEAGYDEEFGERIWPQPYTVWVYTTVPVGKYDDGGDYPSRAHYDFEPWVIPLQGEMARGFMAQYDDIGSLQWAGEPARR